jgi:hypothetical protein
LLDQIMTTSVSMTSGSAVRHRVRRGRASSITSW